MFQLTKPKSLDSSLPRIRISRSDREALEQIAADSMPPATLSGLVRHALHDFVVRNAPHARPGPSETN